MGLRRESAEPAIVLRRTAVGESDLVVSFYCRNLGKITTIARSARRSKKRFGAGLGIFAEIEVALSIKPTATARMWTLESAVPIRLFDALAADMARMAHGSYATELTRELTVDEFPDPELFDLLLEFFRSLQQDGARVGRLRIFELRLLDILGLTPVFDACVGCGKEYPLAFIDAERGGVVCESCAGPECGKWVRPITVDVLRYLQQAQSLAQSLGPVSVGDALEGNPSAISARQEMLSLMYWHVGKPLKSLEFIAKLSKRV